MTRIGLDARMIHSSGIGSYIQGLLSSWMGETGANSLTLFGNTADLGPSPFNKVSFDARIYSLKEQWVGPRTFSRAGLDLLHVPHYNIPLAYRGRLVVTIHDIIHILFPQFSRRRGAWLYARAMLAMALKKSARIITVSRTTRDDVLKHFSVDPKKIRVIYSGISSEFSPAQAQATETALSRYGLKPGFILFVGDVRPHKNLDVLIKTHQKLRKTWDACPPLVIVGKMDRADGRFTNGPEHIHCLGSLPRKDLVHLYSSAGVFVFPSLYEGFGLPPLEAMACGCPVIVSNAGALPESVGEAGLYADPQDPVAWAEAIRKVLEDPSLRKTLIEKGFAKSKEYSWKRTARETRQVYEEALV